MLSSTKSNKYYSFNCNGLPLDLEYPRIMGVVNLTPDSFYAGSRATFDDKLLHRIEQMLEEGMDILDLGAVSSRPGAEKVTEEEETSRLIGPLALIRKRFPKLLISIDTYRSGVLEKALGYDINIVNDISGLREAETMLPLITQYNLPYILMHMQGIPTTMQKNPSYKNVMLELLDFFKEKVHRLRNAGVIDIIIDPGFGFGKAQEHNFEILKKLDVFQILECPILIGLSRKSMIHKTLQIEPNDALNGTTALHMIALLNGAKILRAHDVLEAKQCIDLYTTYNSAG